MKNKRRQPRKRNARPRERASETKRENGARSLLPERYTMRTTTKMFPHWLSSGPLQLLPLLLVLSLIASKAVRASTNAASATLSTTKTSVNRLDLSYLHRCQAGDLAKVIRGTLEEQKELDQQQHPTASENDDNESLT